MNLWFDYGEDDVRNQSSKATKMQRVVFALNVPASSVYCVLSLHAVSYIYQLRVSHEVALL